MNHVIDLQLACDDTLPFSEERLLSWVALVLDEHHEEKEVTIRLVNLDEMTELNKTYRKKEGPTNVLAFPSSLPDGIQLDYPFLGDIIICPAVLMKESVEQHRLLEAHWAHIVIHGILHLLGYDHNDEQDTKIMQAMEVKLLKNLGYTNPYQHEGNDLE